MAENLLGEQLFRYFYWYLVKVKRMICPFWEDKILNKKIFNYFSQLTSSGYSYSLSLSFEFQFSALTQTGLLNQLKTAIDGYSSSSASVYSSVPAGFTFEQINPSLIKSSIQISTSALSSYYASMSRVLVLESSSSSSINPNSVFSSLTISVILCVRFESLYLKLIL